MAIAESVPVTLNLTPLSKKFCAPKNIKINLNAINLNATVDDLPLALPKTPAQKPSAFVDDLAEVPELMLAKPLTPDEVMQKWAEAGRPDLDQGNYRLSRPSVRRGPPSGASLRAGCQVP